MSCISFKINIWGIFFPPTYTKFLWNVPEIFLTLTPLSVVALVYILPNSILFNRIFPHHITIFLHDITSVYSVLLCLLFYRFILSNLNLFCFHFRTTGDLWGPLLVCLLLSSILSATAPGDSASLVFAAVFVIVWCGAAAVTINAQLLGGTISFFQSVCILGYCVFPLTISSIMCLLLSFVYKQVR